MHENNKRNAMLTETEKTRKRNKNYSRGCSSNQGVCRNKKKKRMGPEEGERHAIGPGETKRVGSRVTGSERGI